MLGGIAAGTILPCVCTHMHLSHAIAETYLDMLIFLLTLLWICGAGAHALACKIAEAHSTADEEKAVLELDEMLYTVMSMPKVPSCHAVIRQFI